jgi:hypothetical protein
MPRLPVDGKKVQEQRVTLGGLEREELRTLVTSMQIRNIATPLVSLMKDVTGMATLYLILNAMFPEWLKNLDLPYLDSQGPEGWADWFELQNMAAGAAGGFAGGFIGGFWGGPFTALGLGVLGSIGGILAVEEAEDIVAGEGSGPIPGWNSDPRWAMFMLGLRDSYRKTYPEAVL